MQNAGLVVSVGAPVLPGAPAVPPPRRSPEGGHKRRQHHSSEDWQHRRQGFGSRGQQEEGAARTLKVDETQKRFILYSYSSSPHLLQLLLGIVGVE